MRAGLRNYYFLPGLSKSLLIMVASVALLSIAIHVGGMFLASQLGECTATPAKVISTQKTYSNHSHSGDCHCYTELTLSVPPCVCTGMTEALEEVIRLKADIRELRDKCSTVNTNVIYACKYKNLIVISYNIYYSCIINMHNNIHYYR